MIVGAHVRELSTGSLGVIEKGNNANGFYVSFGARKNWKRYNEIEVIDSSSIGGAKAKATIPAHSATGGAGETSTPGNRPPPTPISASSSTSGGNLKKVSPPPTINNKTFVPKVQSEDPGPRFGNFKFNTTQNTNTNPKYSTLPSRAFFDVSSASSPNGNNFKKTSPPGSSTTSSPSRPAIPDFSNPPSTKNTQSTTTTNVVSNQNGHIVNPPKPQPKPNTPQPTPQPPTQTPISKPLPQPKPNPVPPVAAISKPPPPSIVSPRKNKDLWNIDFSELTFDNVIGNGRYGEVSLGQWLGTPVAIKKLMENDEEANGLVDREIEILKEIRHPQIVQFLGVSRNKENETHIITEFMDGGDLFDALIFGDFELTWKEKLRISLDIAQACRYLQRQGILHRDLKSQNVLLGSNKRAKLCDLGLARVFDDRINKRLTSNLGSDAWMAPEMFMGEEYDYKVDVFSYGIVLVEIITNAVPDPRDPMKRFAFNSQNFMKKVPSECPPAFAKLTVDCTLTNPKERPSFTQILETVKSIYDSLPDDCYDDQEEQ
ncbi:hypothetical protein CYY_006970 [Polysphondylium violaceum]|uniref:non-specific serine/threonine protein kinase n=1 Tax=Polysphondylium violaceum TaxID=133409 RepID=A0A8J4PQ83_9MYCE|nr:hypothetical protein CYY_006970 [Polysphondylium violaceum]